MAKKKQHSPNKIDSPGKGQPAERGFSWFPGHMVKAKRELEGNLKLCDAVLFLLDARAPEATRHQELEKMLSLRQVPFVFILNKVDLALKSETARWRNFFQTAGYRAIEINALKGRGPGPLTPLLNSLNATITTNRSRKGLLAREARLMVAGLPNSGKSALLNRLAGQSRFKTGNKPGLTRGAQWVAVAGRYQLLDTPGILYPRIDGIGRLSVLTAVGCVKREVVPELEVTQWLVQALSTKELPAALESIISGLCTGSYQKEPLDYLASRWGLSRQGDNWQRPVFDRFLNLIATAPICWQQAP